MKIAIDNPGQIRVVVLDDNRNFQNMLRGLLRGFGIRHVETVSDSVALSTLLTHQHVDLGFFDFILGGAGHPNGIDAVRETRLSRRVVNRTMPIVLVTGHASRPVIETAITAGADHVLAKPVSPQTVVGVVNAMLTADRGYVAGPDGYFGPDLEAARRRLQRGAARLETLAAPTPAAPAPEPRRSVTVPGLNVPIRDEFTAFLD